MKMKNGHVDPEPSTIWQHLAERGDAPPSADVLRFAEDVRRVQALVATGLFDEFDVDERIRLCWGIVRHGNEVQN
jgi:hypothetical protein